MTGPEDGPLQDQLVRAARDLWSSVVESADDYVVFIDHRRLSTRVQLLPSGKFQVSWEPDAGEDWIVYGQLFDNPREAAFHGFQGPH
jgi:hypothetical protein